MLYNPWLNFLHCMASDTYGVLHLTYWKFYTIYTNRTCDLVGRSREICPVNYLVSYLLQWRSDVKKSRSQTDVEPMAIRPRYSVIVRLLVSPHFSRLTARRIFPKLGMMLKDNKCRKVTRPFFPGKFDLINYSWKQVLAIFLSLRALIDLILHIMIVQNVSQHLVMVTGHA